MKYVPTSFFKTLSSPILKAIFDKNGITLEGVDWEKREQANDKSVAKAWSDLRRTQSDVQAVADVHEAFQCISELGKPMAEIEYLIGLFKEKGLIPDDSLDDIDEMSPQEQAASVYLRLGRKMLMKLMDASYTRSITQNRWVEFGNAPQLQIEVTQELKDALATEIDKAYTGVKGGNCQVETYPLDDGVIYFHGKMDDKPEFIEMKKPGENDYGYEARVRPFTVTMAYDYEKGKISMAGSLAKKKMAALVAAASKLITGTEAQLERLNKPTYDLTELARVNYRFPSLPGDGISRVYIKTLVLHPDCSSDSEVTFKNIGDGTAYDSIEEYHQGYQLPEGTFTVVKATIIMEFDNADIKSIKFELTPKTCTQTGLLDTQRKLVNKLIEKMGVERR